MKEGHYEEDCPNKSDIKFFRWVLMTAGVTVKGCEVRLNVTIRGLNRARYRHFRRLKTILDVLLPV